jgi:hypothetical protein
MGGGVSKRKSLSKKLRFEVFKRDKFTLKSGYRAGLEIEELKDIATTARNWTDWRYQMERAIEGTQ